MITRKTLVIAVLYTFCLTVSVFSIMPVSSSGGTYNPWYDINDDGKIDLKDVFAVSKAYGTTGEAYNKTELLLNASATYSRLLAHIDAMNGSVKELQLSVDSLGIRTGTLETSLGVVNASLYATKSSLATLESDVLSLKTNVTSLGTRLQLLETRMTTLEVTVVQIVDDIGILYAADSALSARLDILNSTLTGRINLLESALADANSAILDLQGALDVLNATTTERMSIIEAYVAKYGVSFNSTSGGYASTTETLGWVDMSGSSVNIRLNKTSNLLIMFSTDAEMADDQQQYCISIRAMVGSVTADPTSVYLNPTMSDELGFPNAHKHWLGFAAYSYNFVKKSVSPGTYTIKIQWRVTGSTGYAYYKTLAVMAFPTQ